MESALIALIVTAGLTFGADPKTNTEPQNGGDMRRLESVTWDLKTHTLSWVVAKGTEANGEFVPSGSKSYQLTPDDATMGVAKEARSISEEEAAVLHRLLDTLSIYCARSVVWFESPADSTPPSDGTPTLKPAPKKEDDELKTRPTPSRPVKVGLAASARPVEK
uniref:Uncharacterized protein n=1 Tax=Solibacter usitatus (strain Ellin6076) TaxID=234267 RepID=Q029T6_SOLUE